MWCSRERSWFFFLLRAQRKNLTKVKHVYSVCLWFRHSKSTFKALFSCHIELPFIFTFSAVHNEFLFSLKECLWTSSLRSISMPFLYISMLQFTAIEQLRLFMKHGDCLFTSIQFQIYLAMLIIILLNMAGEREKSMNRSWWFQWKRDKSEIKFLWQYSV